MKFPTNSTEQELSELNSKFFKLKMDVEISKVFQSRRRNTCVRINDFEIYKLIVF